MARLEAVRKAGYFPLPAEAAAPIARLVALGAGRHCILDPCAADGAALALLVETWSRSRADAADWEVYACELEGRRAEALRAAAERRRGGPKWQVAEGDAMSLAGPSAPGRAGGATVLYLNPPYDRDPAWGRLEARWLDRWSLRLGAGGALVLVVPPKALPSCADLLGRRFEVAEVLRLPEPHYSTYAGKIILLARRLVPGAEPAEPSLESVRRAREAALRPEALRPLWGPGSPEAPVLRPPGLPAGNGGWWERRREGPVREGEWQARGLDWEGALADFRPWRAQERRGGLGRIRSVAPDRGLADLVGRTYPLASPPRPGHLAAAIACGIFNGARIEPSEEGRAAGLPRLLVKGVFDRRFREVEVKFDRDGNPRASVQVQYPRLRVTVLDPDRGEVVELASDTEPTESLDLRDFTVGDLLLRYGSSLLEALRERCPLRFGEPDPGEVRGRLEAAAFRRRLLDAQARSAATAAAALAADRRHWLQGQTGTGKTTMALAALALRGLRRPLVMAPPHLCAKTWPDEVAACYGSDGLVVHVREPSDLDALALLRGDPRRVVAVVPRDLAKLGHGYEGLAGPCPRCGAPSPASPAQLASRRARCRAEVCDPAALSPGQRAARAFAEAVVLAAPQGEAVGALLVGSPRLSRARAAAAGGPVVTAEEAASSARSAAAAAPALRAALAAAAAAGEVARGLRERAGRRRRTSPSVAAARAVLVGAAAALAAASAPASSLAEAAALWLAAAEQVPSSERGADTPFAELCMAGRWGLRAARAAGGAALAGEVLAPYEARLTEARRAWPPSEAGWRARQEVAGLVGRLEDPPEGLTLPPEVRPRAWEAAATLLLAGFGRPPARRCGEALWCAAPPRRVPLSRAIAERATELGIDAVVVDEAHEYNAAGSAQGAAARRLRRMNLPTLYLTGSTSNGYAEHLHEVLQALSADFRTEFGPREHALFQERFGYVKRQVDLQAGQGAAAAGAGAEEVEREYGARSERIVAGGVRIVGKAPGVMPEAVLRWLLPHSTAVALEEVARDLPPLSEHVVRVPPDPRQAERGAHLLREVVDEIRSARTDPLRRGRLFGALAELPSYFDLCRDAPAALGLDRYEVRYPSPDGRGDLVAAVEAHPPSASLPKEAELARIVAEQAARGRPCLVLAWHTLLVEGLAERLRGALREAGAGELRVAHLPRSVEARRREAWISALLGRGSDVLVAQPRAIETGLNNLVHYPTQIWYECPGCNPYVRRQVTGRALRIGQSQDVEVYSLVYAGEGREGSLQLALHELLAHKVGVSEAIDGLDATAALQAAGVGDQDATASMSVGRALYELLRRTA